jgi:hypothetical protein
MNLFTTKSMMFMTTPAAKPPIRTFCVFMAMLSSLGDIDGSRYDGHSVGGLGSDVKRRYPVYIELRQGCQRHLYRGLAE